LLYNVKHRLTNKSRYLVIHCIMAKKNKLMAFRTTESQRKFLEKVASMDDRSLSWVIDGMIDWFRVNKTPGQTLQSVRDAAAQIRRSDEVG